MKSLAAGGFGGSPSVHLLSLLLAATAGGGCDPYGTFNDTPDDSLGVVDPVNFPPANVGVGGDRKRPGRGRFQELVAFFEGQEIGYFSFTLPTLPAGSDPLRVLDDGKPYGPVATPVAYVFDSAPPGSPFPEGDRYPCAPPAGYQFDVRRDAVDFTKQGNVFSTLPTEAYAEGVAPSSTYVPVVQEARLSSSGQPCQRLKSEKRIEEVLGMKPAPTPNYLAWLVIEPAARVVPREFPTGNFPMGHPMAGQMHPGVGIQRWGWFNRYLLAYIDGGYIPTEDGVVTGGTMAMPTMRMVKRMRPQRLFIPRAVLSGAMMTMGPGRPGQGYDVLEARRGQPTYSPICQVWVYGDPMMPVPAADLPKAASAIVDPMSALNPMPAAPASFVYCLQAR